MTSLGTPPTRERIETARATLARWIRPTPVFELPGQALDPSFSPATRVVFKLELWQVTGTFKARGALLAVLGLPPEQRRAGVTAVSAGNHGIAVAFAARELGTHAKIVMPRTSSPLRVARCRSFGAEVVHADDVAQAFAACERLARDEGRAFLHPFEGEATVIGTATLGLEWVEQTADLDAAIVAVGGGGLCAGVASAFAMASPATRVYAVEPEGADSLAQSLEAGRPLALAAVRTIADSLGSPRAEPYTFSLCQRFVHRYVRLSDAAIVDGMKTLYDRLSLAVEPACAASTAALLGPLRDELDGKRVGVLLCGSNLEFERFAALVRG